jgi:hypothetical protein
MRVPARSVPRALISAFRRATPTTTTKIAARRRGAASRRVGLGYADPQRTPQRRPATQKQQLQMRAPSLFFIGKNRYPNFSPVHNSPEKPASMRPLRQTRPPTRALSRPQKQPGSGPPFGQGLHPI